MAKHFLIWDHLEQMYGGTSRVKVCRINVLMSQYKKFYMLSYKNIDQMYARFLEITNELYLFGKVISNKEKIMKILRSLPSSWETKASILIETKDIRVYPLEEVSGSLKAHEMQMKNQVNSDDELPIYQGCKSSKCPMHNNKRKKKMKEGSSLWHKLKKGKSKKNS